MSEIASNAVGAREDFDDGTLFEMWPYGCPKDLAELAKGKRNRTKPDIKAMAVLLGLMLNAYHADQTGRAQNSPTQNIDIDKELEDMYGLTYAASKQFADYPAQIKDKASKDPFIRGGGVTFAAHFAGVSIEAARKWFDEIGEAITTYAETENSIFLDDCWGRMQAVHENIKYL